MLGTDFVVAQHVDAFVAADAMPVVDAIAVVDTIAVADATAVVDESDASAEHALLDAEHCAEHASQVETVLEEQLSETVL